VPFAVLSVDEKSQIQALDRTQPGLPMKKGRGTTMTHDYKRNGTTTLFAALNTANGEVFGLCQEKHRHQKWLRFLRMIDQTLGGSSRSWSRPAPGRGPDRCRQSSSPSRRQNWLNREYAPLSSQLTKVQSHVPVPESATAIPSSALSAQFGSLPSSAA
jgi:hypothetical protein